MMLKKITLIAAVVLMAVSCGKTNLKKGHWNKDTRAAIAELIRTEGNKSETYDPENPPYAVFDFDNTTIIGDISVSAMAWQIENLRFAVHPDSIYDALTECIPDIDQPLEGVENTSSRMLATDILNDYIYLYDNYISLPEGQRDLETVRQSDEYQDFRAKVWALSAGADATFGYAVGCTWILRLYDGVTNDGIREIAYLSAHDALAMKKIKKTKWTSPDMGEAGQVTVTFNKGLGIAKEMQDLYKVLKANGFDIYICSASQKGIVEAVACAPEYGFDVPEDHVYGLKYHEGKVETIRKEIAPSHNGADPVLVAGDSDGDYEMLTEFEGMKTGLIINTSASPKISELKKKGGKYKVQDVRVRRKKFRR